MFGICLGGVGDIGKLAGRLLGHVGEVALVRFWTLSGDKQTCWKQSDISQQTKACVGKQILFQGVALIRRAIRVELIQHHVHDTLTLMQDSRPGF